MNILELENATKERGDDDPVLISRACKTDVLIGEDQVGIPHATFAWHAQNSNTRMNTLTTFDDRGIMMSSPTPKLVGGCLSEDLENSSSLSNDATITLDVNGDTIPSATNEISDAASYKAPARVGYNDDEVQQLRKERDDALGRVNHFQHQLDILFQSMTLISRLSAMDSESYSRTIATTCSADDVSCSSSTSSIQAQLDQLQQEWKLEQTPIPKLISSVHRLHSNIQLLQSQADNYNTNENTSNQVISSLKEKVATCKEENKMLKKATKKLMHNNKRMKEKLNEKRAERKSLVRSVREYVKKKKEEDLDKEELFVATKLTVHESMLKNARNNNENGNTSNRQRTWTGDSIQSLSSTFSDFDDSFQYIHHDYDSSHLLDEENNESNDVGEPPMRQGYSTDSSISLCDSPASSSSVTSYVTDDKSPTVRFSTPESDLPQPYTLTLPQDKIGLQFLQVELSSVKSMNGSEYRQQIATHHGLMPKNMSFGNSTGNRYRAFSDGCALDLSVLEEDSEEITKDKKTSLCDMKISSKKVYGDGRRKMPKAHHTFKIDQIFKLKESLSSDKNLGSNRNQKQSAFLVQDFQGFDTSLNVRPTLGARLIAIHDKSLLEGEWTMKKVLKYLENVNGKGNGSIELTFRNDPLDKEQKALLDLNVGSDKGMEDSQSSQPGKPSLHVTFPAENLSSTQPSATIASMPKAKKSLKQSFLGMKITKKAGIDASSPKTEVESKEVNNVAACSTNISQDATEKKKEARADPIHDALGINFLKEVKSKKKEAKADHISDALGLNFIKFF